MRLARYLPILEWGRAYGRASLGKDLVAGVIVTIMLVPQGLAYALLAGLPPEAGLYASILPLVAYAIFGTSRTLAVGPVAVVSLMTATALSAVAAPGSAEYVAAALVLAAISGLVLLAMGFMRLGVLANYLSHPVVAGFITAAALLIALGQTRHVLGIGGSGETLPQMLSALAANVGETSLPTLALGVSAIAFLLWFRKGLNPLLRRMGVPPTVAEIVVRTAPVLVVLASTAAVAALDLAGRGVAVVGKIPVGLPPLTMPVLDVELWSALLLPAVLISIIGYVESVSVAQTLAAKRRERIDPDQELIGIGAANVASAFSGGYPVTGGFARSVVNFDAGAQTPAAGAFAALGIAVAMLTLTPLLYFLPLAVLSATIIVAVMGLIDFHAPRDVWRYSKSDFAAMAATIGATLGFGVELGVLTGIAISVGLLLWRVSRPHAAVVGLVPGTQHFRNVLRHQVLTSPDLLTLRIDESLTFVNARWLEEKVLELAAERPDLRHLVLMCSAVNEIDASALESLRLINARLRDAGVCLHFSEVKGPVMDRLERSHLLGELTGRVFLSQYDAYASLTGKPRADVNGPWPPPQTTVTQTAKP
jgi:sulfate permease, SulP family